MGTRWLADIAARIVAGGRDPATPAAAIERGTTPQQRVVVARLGDLAERVRAAGLAAPVVVVIGRVVEFREHIAWYEQLPLFAKRVLVPRAPQQADELALELRRRGAEPVAVPLLEFAPSSRPEELARACAAAAEYDWIVFTSANAVRASAPLLAPLGRARVACIGAATARAAESAGLRVELAPAGRGLARGARARSSRARASWPARGSCSRARRARARSWARSSPAGARGSTRPRPTRRARQPALARLCARRSRTASTPSRSPAPRPSSTSSRCSSPTSSARLCATRALRVHRRDHGRGAARRPARATLFGGGTPVHGRARRGARARPRGGTRWPFLSTDPAACAGPPRCASCRARRASFPPTSSTRCSWSRAAACASRSAPCPASRACRSTSSPTRRSGSRISAWAASCCSASRRARTRSAPAPTTPTASSRARSAR